MKLAERFYVYEHTRRDTGGVFYVGKGCGRRAFSKSSRSKHWRAITSKHGYDVRFVVTDIQEELALLTEIERIDQLSRLGIRLANLTIGGDGICLNPSSEAKRIAAVVAAQLRTDVRVKRSNSMRIAWSESGYRERVGSAISAAFQRESSRAKKSAASKASSATRAKQVICLETGTTFKSMAEAAKWAGEATKFSASPSKICLACQGERKSAYGYTWKYDKREN